MDAVAAEVEPVSENGGRDVAQAVVEVEIDVQTESKKPSFVPAAAAEENANGAESELEDKEPPGILKTPQLQSFEDGIQHTVEPQKTDEEEQTKK